MAKANMIEIENFTSPGSVYRVDAEKYEAMRRAVMLVVPETSPGMTVAELRNAAIVHLPDALFPGGAKAGWWLKAVQLDLEAKKVLRRQPGSPVRLHRY